MSEKSTPLVSPEEQSNERQRLLLTICCAVAIILAATVIPIVSTAGLGRSPIGSLVPQANVSSPGQQGSGGTSAAGAGGPGGPGFGGGGGLNGTGSGGTGSDIGSKLGALNLGKLASDWWVTCRSERFVSVPITERRVTLYRPQFGSLVLAHWGVRYVHWWWLETERWSGTVPRSAATERHQGQAGSVSNNAEKARNVASHCLATDESEL